MPSYSIWMSGVRERARARERARVSLAACFDSDLQMTAHAGRAHLFTCAFVLLYVWHAYKRACVCKSDKERQCWMNERGVVVYLLFSVWSGESFFPSVNSWLIYHESVYVCVRVKSASRGSGRRRRRRRSMQRKPIRTSMLQKQMWKRYFLTADVFC